MKKETKKLIKQTINALYYFNQYQNLASKVYKEGIKEIRARKIITLYRIIEALFTQNPKEVYETFLDIEKKSTNNNKAKLKMTTERYYDFIDTLIPMVGKEEMEAMSQELLNKIYPNQPKDKESLN